MFGIQRAQRLVVAAEREACGRERRRLIIPTMVLCSGRIMPGLYSEFATRVPHTVGGFLDSAWPVVERKRYEAIVLKANMMVRSADPHRVPAGGA